MRCPLGNRELNFICIQSAAASAAALCVPILLLLLMQQCCSFLLLFVIMHRAVKFVAGPLNLIPVFSFSSFKHDLFFMVPLGSTAVSHLQPRFAYSLDLPTASLITCMRGAKAGVSPPRRISLCITSHLSTKLGYIRKLCYSKQLLIRKLHNFPHLSRKTPFFREKTLKICTRALCVHPEA